MKPLSFLLPNHAEPFTDGFLLGNDFAPSADNWVQLVPYGDFPHSGPLGADGKPLKKNGKVVFPAGVVQRIDNETGSALVNHFNSVASRATRAFVGLPWYVGHHDLDPIKYPDPKAYGWVKDMANRQDGVYAQVEWTPEGKDLIEKKAFKFFSPYFSRGESTGVVLANGRGVIRPVALKSVGFTNNPNIGVMPLANEADDESTLANEQSSAAGVLIVAAIRRGVLKESDRDEWMGFFNEDFDSAVFALVNAGNREGALKGWETRRAGMAGKKGVAAKVVAKRVKATKLAKAGKLPIGDKEHEANEAKLSRKQRFLLREKAQDDTFSTGAAAESRYRQLAAKAAAARTAPTPPSPRTPAPVEPGGLKISLPARVAASSSGGTIKPPSISSPPPTPEPPAAVRVGASSGKSGLWHSLKQAFTNPGHDPAHDADRA